MQTYITFFILFISCNLFSQDWQLVEPFDGIGKYPQSILNSNNKLYIIYKENNDTLIGIKKKNKLQFITSQLPVSTNIEDWKVTSKSRLFNYDKYITFGIIDFIISDTNTAPSFNYYQKSEYDPDTIQIQVIPSSLTFDLLGNIYFGHYKFSHTTEKWSFPKLCNYFDGFTYQNDQFFLFNKNFSVNDSLCSLKLNVILNANINNFFFLSHAGYDSDTLLAFTDSFPQISYNGGKNWNLMNKGINKPMTRGLITKNKDFIAYTNNEIYLYNKVDSIWENITYNIGNKYIVKIIEFEKGNLYALANNELYRFQIDRETGMPKQLDLTNYNLFPNPTNGYLSLQSTIDNGIIKVFSSNQQLLDIIKFNYRSTIDLSLYKSGIYFFEISDFNNKTQSFQKIVKF